MREMTCLWQGYLRKMSVRRNSDGTIIYNLPESEGQPGLELNSLLGKEVSLTFDGDIKCVLCGAKIRKTYADGLCYPCFRDAPENAECIIRPELCRAHEGGGRDPEWEKKHHLQPHTVYISYTSGLKVGVTRNDQVPVRWIDQGAVAALRLAETPNRYLAGCIEVALKEFFADKTAFRKMLTLTELPPDNILTEAAQRAGSLLEESLQVHLLSAQSVLRLNFPSLVIPPKIKSLGFDKNPLVSGTLSALKGQYLLFEDGRVINIRRHTGYYVAINATIN